MSHDAGLRENSMAMAAWALVLACLLWAGNFVTGRWLRGVVDPEMLNFLRWFLASVAFLPMAGGRLLRHRDLLLRHWGWVLGLGVSGVIGFQQATYTALTQVPVANAVLLLATTPMMILASSAAMGKSSLDSRKAVAVVLSLCGVAVILGDGNPLEVLKLRLTAGDWWLLGAVVCWTAYTQLLRAAPPGLPGDVSLLASMLVALPVLLLLVVLRSETELSALPVTAWAGILYVALGAALLAFLAWGFGVARMGPDAAGLYLNLIPVFSVVLAWILLGEAISRGQAAGAGFILVALILGTRRAKTARA